MGLVLSFQRIFNSEDFKDFSSDFRRKEETARNQQSASACSTEPSRCNCPYTQKKTNKPNRWTYSMQGQSRAFVFLTFWHVLLNPATIIYYLFSILTGIFGDKDLFKVLCSKSAELLSPYSYDFESLAWCICLTWHLNWFLAFILFDSKVPLAVCIKACMEVPIWLTELNEYYLPFHVLSPYNKGIAAAKITVKFSI